MALHQSEIDEILNNMTTASLIYERLGLSTYGTEYARENLAKYMTALSEKLVEPNDATEVHITQAPDEDGVLITIKHKGNEAAKQIRRSVIEAAGDAEGQEELIRAEVKALVLELDPDPEADIHIAN